jgi:hypothetical protein
MNRLNRYYRYVSFCCSFYSPKHSQYPKDIHFFIKKMFPKTLSRNQIMLLQELHQYELLATIYN